MISCFVFNILLKSGNSVISRNIQILHHFLQNDKFRLEFIINIQRMIVFSLNPRIVINYHLTIEIILILINS